jgi:uncharacterized protein (TIGR03085 family)
MMGGMTHLALRERRALCDTFERVGPDAPTLCGDWTTAELAAHLVIRERRPDLAAGFYVAPLARRTEQAQDEYAARPWGELVDLFRSGPPSWSPTKVATVDNLVNLGEFFVHHEDVLRAQDGPARELHPRLEDALWTSLRRGARLLLRSAATGVVLVSDRGRIAAKGPTDLGTVVVRGRPGELTLFAFGRARVADVEVEGSPEAVDALRESPIGPG